MDVRTSKGIKSEGRLWADSKFDLRFLVSLDVLSTLFHFEEYCRVTSDNDHTRQKKAKSEQETLGRSTVITPAKGK